MGLAQITLNVPHGHVVLVRMLASFPRPDLGTTSGQISSSFLANRHLKPGRAPLVPTGFCEMLERPRAQLALI